ncbi:hypothetical protein [Serratia oryzae]|nr:hypothetical protein [Serratia oryzae]VXC77593.1 conserved hypothetical protein [Enterobacterales bacterium 8AC]
MKVTHQKVISGKKYQLEFYDGFDQEELDKTRWLPYYLPQWSNRELSIPHFTFSESRFSLNIEPNQQPWCPEFNGAIRVLRTETQKICVSLSIT